VGGIGPDLGDQLLHVGAVQRPDAGSVARTGGCTDEAGNSSPPSTFHFHYDATAPGGLGVAPARPPDHDGWYNHPLAIRWFASDVLAGIASCTSLTYGGPDETGGRCPASAPTAPATGARRCRSRCATTRTRPRLRRSR
jgi:hypothetical protein